jgi:hypothetical protein
VALARWCCVASFEADAAVAVGQGDKEFFVQFGDYAFALLDA